MISKWIDKEIAMIREVKRTVASGYLALVLLTVAQLGLA